MTDAHVLDTITRDYAWGSTSLLADLRGDEPTDAPEAEVWLGAHPGAPSRIRVDGVPIGLDEAIDADGATWLGDAADVAAGRLPYLLKLLAAGTPLSLQAHPSKQKAEAGFAAENAAGVPIDAPHRNYKDDNHKPELLCALTPFRALAGFRAVDETVELLRALDAPVLAPIVERLAGDPGPEELRSLLREILTMDTDAAAELSAGVMEALERVGDGAPQPQAREVARFIGETYPGESGIVTALLLNTVVLSPGEAIYLDAGLLHAYIDGLGVEIMAASDNVLRGGLTPKHVDVDELLDVLEMVTGPTPIITGEVDGQGRRVWPTPAPEFELTAVDVDGPGEFAAPGPEVLVVTEGEVEVEGQRLLPSQSAVVPAGSTWRLDGNGTAFIARVPGLS